MSVVMRKLTDKGFIVVLVFMRDGLHTLLSSD